MYLKYVSVETVFYAYEVQLVFYHTGIKYPLLQHS